MAAWRPETGLIARCLGVALLALAWAVPLQADLIGYQATYSLSRNGKTAGKVEVTLAPEGEGWSVSSELSGTHGLARILAVRDHEKVLGRLQDGRFLPDQYWSRRSIAGIGDRWYAFFDREAGSVSITHDKDEPVVLELVGDSLDPLSLKLEMRRRLADPEPDLHFMMVEEDEIDEQNFRLLPREWLETSLGCLETVPVEKIRRSSTRYTRAWHAPDLAHIEVRMEHGKQGGDHIELRITELVLDGTPVEPRPGCSALNRGDRP